MELYGMLWYGMVWYGMRWYSISWYERYGAVLYCMVSCSCGLVWYVVVL
jgi:hypothetical protein